MLRSEVLPLTIFYLISGAILWLAVSRKASNRVYVELLYSFL